MLILCYFFDFKQIVFIKFNYIKQNMVVKKYNVNKAKNEKAIMVRFYGKTK